MVQLSKEQSKNLRVLQKNYDIALTKACEYDGDNLTRMNRLWSRADQAMDRLRGADRMATASRVKEAEIVVKRFRGFNKVQNRVRLVDEDGRKLAIKAEEIYTY